MLKFAICPIFDSRAQKISCLNLTLHVYEYLNSYLKKKATKTYFFSTNQAISYQNLPPSLLPVFPLHNKKFSWL